MLVRFTLNGKDVEQRCEPEATLLSLLRDGFGLTGTKEGCKTGDCGACTVLVDNEAVSSCIYPAAKVSGRSVLTIEGLAESGQLDPIQQAFIDAGAVQCGYCTPGMIMSAKALLLANENPSREQVKAALAGNLCRCTGYEQIIEAVEKARDVLLGIKAKNTTEPSETADDPPKRIDAVAKVTGVTKYVTDMSLPGMLWVEAVRSPHPHAVVEDIDTTQAETFPGVACVLTAKDIPGVNAQGNYNVADQPVLVAIGDKVRLKGEAVALVASPDRETARAAARKVKVKYNVLEPVTDPIAALQDGVPKVWDKLLCTEYEYTRGDVDKSLQQADFVVSETYSIEPQEHAYLETEAALASMDENRILTLWAPTHDVWYVRQGVAAVLGIPESRVRVIAPQIGGSFGGKQPLTVHPLVALVALRTNRPAKMVWSREESLRISTKRHGVVVRHRLGATKDGILTAMDAEVVLDAGPYTSESPGVTRYMAMHMTSAYAIPNVSIRSKSLFTNNPIGGAYRGFGGPQGVLPTELQMDALAKKVGIDPVEFRRINAIPPGSELTMPGIVMCGKNELSSSFEPILGNLPEKPKASPGTVAGRGIVSTMSLYCVGAQRLRGARGTGIDLEFLRDGSLVMHTSQVEMGVGTISALVGMVAESFGVELDRVSVRFGDTDSTPKAGPQVASRTLFTSGKAVVGAIAVLKERILGFVSRKYEEKLGALEITEGAVVSRESGRTYRLSDFAEGYYQDGQDPKACYWYETDHTNAGHTFSSGLADVEIDTETGQVSVKRLWFCHDAGRAMNMQNIRGQHFGGALQSQGHMLTESLALSKGSVEASDLRTYMIPTTLDAPDDFRCFVVENPDEYGPMGARGIAEHANDLVPAIVACAVSDALGTIVTHYPVKPETILDILAERKANT